MGDHFAGLPFLILDGQFSRRTSPLLVAGPPGIRARLTEAMETLFPGSSRAARRFPVEVTELKTDGTPALAFAMTVALAGSMIRQAWPVPGSPRNHPGQKPAERGAPHTSAGET